MDFREFVIQLKKTLDSLKDSPRVVLFEKMPSIAETTPIAEHFVFVGCGPWHEMEDESTAARPLLLNNKGSVRRFGLVEDYVSVSAMVMDNPVNFLEQWSLWPADWAEPAELLERITVVAEDAGPDSIFCLLLLLARAAGVDPNQFPKNWLDAVNEWERGGISGEPLRSWCALESALAHGNFPVTDALTRRSMSNAWLVGLRFAAAAICACGPDELPLQSISMEHAAAKAALEQEYQLYEEWLQHAQIVQLSVPLKEANDRHLLVDALLVEEVQIAGSVKLFYRNDKVNSPLGQGFRLAAHYRPTSQESAYDITISVDPRCGLTLRDLHAKIEVSEHAKWLIEKKIRPQSRPRFMDNVPNEWDEPWYMNREHTLIAAPRRLGGGEFGSLLTWEEVREILWQTYCPLHGVLVTQDPCNSVPVPILKVKPDVLMNGGAEKKLLTASWHKPNSVGGARSLPAAPTAWQVMVALIAEPCVESISGRDEQEILKRVSYPQLPILKKLPQVGSYKSLHLTGGFAVVSQSGAFVIDDWTVHSLDLSEMRESFAKASTLHDRLKELHSGLNSLTSAVHGALAQRITLKQTKVLLAETARLSTEASAVRAFSSIPPGTVNARAFRQALSDMWNLEANLDSYEKAILSLQAALRNVVESGTASLARFITAFGVGAAIGGTLAGPSAKALYAWIYSSSPTSDAPGWWVIIAFVMFLAIGSGGVYWFLFASRFLPRKMEKGSV